MFFAQSEVHALALPNFIENFCKDIGLGFCQGAATKDQDSKETQKKRTFTASEQEVLTRLIEKEKQLKAKEKVLNRRQKQLKALEEDVQNQISQLESLQKDVEKDIERKKIQDREQLNKAVDFYAKMDPAKAAASIGELNIKTAVQILLKIKNQQASNILEAMDAQKSARLVEEIARK